MKRMVVLGAVCMMLVATAVGLSGCPVTGGEWPVLDEGKEYMFQPSDDNTRRITIVSQRGQWVTGTGSNGSTVLVNLENVLFINAYD